MLSDSTVEYPFEHFENPFFLKSTEVVSKTLPLGKYFVQKITMASKLFIFKNQVLNLLAKLNSVADRTYWTDRNIVSETVRGLERYQKPIPYFA